AARLHRRHDGTADRRTERKKLSRAAFLYLKFGPEQHPLPKKYERRFLRQFIADETGWTLPDVDAMNAEDIADWLAVREAQIKARPKPPPPPPRKGKRGRGRRR